MEKNALIALHYGDATNLVNCLVFGYSLSRVGSRAERILLIVEGTDPVHREILAPFFDRVISVQSIDIPEGAVKETTPVRLQGAFNKLWAFTLTEYDNIVLIDTDTLINRNFDEIFSFPSPAVFVCDNKYAWHVGTRVSEEDMAPQLGKKLGYINSGVSLFRPSEELCESLFANFRASIPPPEGYRYADQCFLAQFFLGKWHSLSGLYNFSAKFYSLDRYFGYGRKPILVPVEDIAIFHFYGDLKPLDYLRHRDSVWKREKPLRASQVELLRRLEADAPLPDFSEARTATDYYLALFNYWFQTFNAAKRTLPANLHRYVDKAATTCTVIEKCETVLKRSGDVCSEGNHPRRNRFRPRAR